MQKHWQINQLQLSNYAPRIIASTTFRLAWRIHRQYATHCCATSPTPWCSNDRWSLVGRNSKLIFRQSVQPFVCRAVIEPKSLTTFAVTTARSATASRGSAAAARILAVHQFENLVVTSVNAQRGQCSDLGSYYLWCVCVENEDMTKQRVNMEDTLMEFELFFYITCFF